MWSRLLSGLGLTPLHELCENSVTLCHDDAVTMGAATVRDHISTAKISLKKFKAYACNCSFVPSAICNIQTCFQEVLKTQQVSIMLNFR